MNTAKKLSIRLEAVGGDKVRNEFKKLGTEGQQAFNRITQVITPANDNLKLIDNTAKAFNNTLKQASALAGAYLGLRGMTNIFRSIVNTNKEFESLSGSLKTVTGSAQGAKEAFALIEKFALDTPFQLDEIVESFIRLKALGIEPSVDALTSYGNTASAFGKNLMDFTDALSNAVTSNHSDRNGGAIATRGYAANEGAANSENTPAEGKVLIENSVFDGNTAKYGGAIFTSFGEGSRNGVDITGNTTIVDSQFKGNSATQLGGAIYNTYFVADDSYTTSKGTGGGHLLLKGNNIFSGNSDSTGSNDIYNLGTIDVSGNLTLDGGISGNGSGTITFAEGSSLTAKLGTTTIADNTVTTNGSTLNLIIATGAEDGTYEFLTGSSAFADKAFSIADNTLYNISWADDNQSIDFDKKASSEIAAAVTEVAGESITNNQASAIAAVISGETGNAVFDQVSGNISTLLQSSNAAEVKAGLDATTALAPEVAPMVQTAATETVNQIFGAVSTRLSGGSVATASEGKSSGDGVFERAAMWIQGLFNKSKLDDSSKGKGFDADTHGIAFGFEKNLENDVKAGVGYAYSKTDIDGFMRSTDVDTHTVMAYGEYKPSNWFVNGVVSYGWSDYDESKNVTGVNVGAKYDAETFALQAMTGYEMNVNGYGITPEAGLRYVHVKQDSYTDTAGQRVSTDDNDTLTGIVGAKVAKSWELDNGMIVTPEVRAAATYDLMNDDTNAVVALANGSSYAVKGKALDRFGMEFGAGITAEVNDEVEVSVGYEGKFRKDYTDHTALLNAKYKF